MQQGRKQAWRGNRSPETQQGSTQATRQLESDSSLSDTALVKTLEIATLSPHDREPTVRIGGLPETPQSSVGTSPERSQPVGAAAPGLEHAEKLDLIERLVSLEKQVRLRDAALNATTTHFVI